MPTKAFVENLVSHWKEDPNLQETPERIERMYREELFKNVDKEFTDWKAFPNEKGYNQLIVFDRIFFSSTCSHHFVPFTGFAYIAYIPGDYLVGASKPMRAVEHYAARPQIQENLCHEVLQSFTEAAKPIGAAVIMKASHMCVVGRGAKQPTSKMVTSALFGKCFEDKVKWEIFELIKLQGGLHD